jgi:hypothetical protein
MVYVTISWISYLEDIRGVVNNKAFFTFDTQ